MKERLSPQTKCVLSVLSDSRCHLSAEEIQARLDGIGTATVYRALDHLAELGLIHRLSLGRKKAVYEAMRQPHMHFVCRHCGLVDDIEADFSGMVGEAARCHGHEFEWAEITAYGLCKNCFHEMEAKKEDK